jgi:hypothetical protein
MHGWCQSGSQLSSNGHARKRARCKAAVITETIRKRNNTFSLSHHEVHISPHHITTFLSRINMRDVHADLQNMKRSRTLCIRSFTRIPKHLCRWQRSSWSELTNVWKRKGDRDSKTTTYLFLCVLCRRKKDISCPCLLISPRIVDGKVW